MSDVFIPFYESDVQESTYESRKSTLEILVNRFGNKLIRAISVEGVQHFRTWLLSKRGANYSQSYASLVFGMFKRTLGFAVTMQYLSTNAGDQSESYSKR